MLSLSAAKDGVIPPSEEDRKRIITQMKVRTTLKEDKSWIQKRSNSEEEKNHSMARSPQRTRATVERSSVSQTTLSPNHRVNSAEQSSQREPQSPSTLKSPSQKSPTTVAPSGYLIRGVFRKTIDKTSPSDTTSNGSLKSAKNASLPRFSQSYKMTTDEYKKLAPYNIKRELSDPGEEEPSVSPDEQKKRTEAASSVLRQTAVRQRSYVLSAAKKSNGSPSQEAQEAKRTVEEDDVGPRSRSQTVPASAWFNSRGKSTTNGERRTSAGTTLHESKLDTTASSTSIDTSRRRSPASRTYEEASSIFRNSGSPETRPVLDHKVKSANGEFQHRSPSSQATEISEHESDSAKAQSFSRDNPDAAPGSRYGAATHPNNREDGDSKRTSSGFERKTTQDAAYESPSDSEYKKVEAYLAKSGSCSSESSINTAGTQNETLRMTGMDGSDQDAARSSPVSAESGVATPESQQGDPGSDSDTSRRSRWVTCGISHTSHRMPAYVTNPASNFRVMEGGPRTTRSYLGQQANSTISPSGANLETESYQYNQQYNSDTLKTYHEQTSLQNYQTSNFRRTYYPFRDGAQSGSPRSHRMPFYNDISDTDNKSKGILFLKQSVNSTELSSSPRYNSRSLVDLSEFENLSYSGASYLNSSPVKRTPEDFCTYCGREIRNCAKITIDNLKICCHDYCFRCGICYKPMGDLLDKIFIHRDIVHCDKCYEKLF